MKHGLKLENPNLLALNFSNKIQFTFYFTFMILGILGAYGCFYTSFSLPLSLQIFMTYLIVFCAVFTIIFLFKFRYIILLIPILVVSFFVFFHQINLIDELTTNITQGFYHTYNSVITAYSNKVQYPIFTYPTAPASINEIIAYVTIFAVISLLFYSFLIAWILVHKKNTFLCFLLTAPFLVLPLICNIIPKYSSVAVLYMFWAFLILCSPYLNNKNKFNKKKDVFYSGDTSTNPHLLIFIPILTACLIFITLLFPIKSFQRSDFVKNRRIDLLNIPNISSPFQIAIQNLLGYTDSVNLQTIGDISFTGKTVLKVKSSSQQSEYLKGFVGSIYTGQSWDTLPEEEYEKLTSLLQEWKVQNFTSQFNKLLGRPSKIYDLTIKNVNRNSLRIYIPYGLISQPEELPGIDFINDGFLVSNNTLFGTNEYSMKSTNLQIDGWKLTESLMNAFSEQSSFIHAAKNYMHFVNKHYTQLPDTLKDKLNQYRHENNLYIENYYSPVSFANAIVTQLRSENSYTLSPGITPEKQDFVEYFLFESHKGYCVHFASATVALLRSAGIPARYVEGYAISTTDFKENSEWANIPDSRFHAWVEIYMNAVGWVPIEATPRAYMGIVDHDAAESETLTVRIPIETDLPDNQMGIREPLNLNDLSSIKEDYSDSIEMQNTTINPIINAIKQILSILLKLCLFITTLLVSRKLQIYLRNKAFIQQNNNKATIAVYNYIVKLFDFAKISESSDYIMPKDLYNLVLKARFSQHMITEQELESLKNYANNQALEIQTKVTLIKRFIGMYIYVLF